MPSFFIMPLFFLARLLIDPLDMPLVFMPWVFAPAVVCEPLLLASLTLGDVVDVCGVAVGVCADAFIAPNADMATAHAVTTNAFFTLFSSWYDV